MIQSLQKSNIFDYRRHPTTALVMGLVIGMCTGIEGLDHGVNNVHREGSLFEGDEINVTYLNTSSDEQHTLHSFLIARLTDRSARTPADPRHGDVAGEESDFLPLADLISELGFEEFGPLVYPGTSVLDGDNVRDWVISFLMSLPAGLFEAQMVHSLRVPGQYLIEIRLREDGIFPQPTPLLKHFRLELVVLTPAAYAALLARESEDDNINGARS